ncbi:MAG: PilZ domain-containing protein [Candidatus Omnitrophica bacterium]|nr:PilZ domain-containing protein [Candidatus Omnitrophota bacterium]
MAGKIPKGFNAQSQNLSGGGLYLTTEEVEFIRIGAVLRVSLAVPWKLRGNIPFSRISGSCRVVRIDDKSKEEKDLVGVAIAFCGNDLTMLGTMTGPAA